jgi:hypothetical protein
MTEDLGDSQRHYPSATITRENPAAFRNRRAHIVSWPEAREGQQRARGPHRFRFGRSKVILCAKIKFQLKQ